MGQRGGPKGIAIGEAEAEIALGRWEALLQILHCKLCLWLDPLCYLARAVESVRRPSNSLLTPTQCPRFHRLAPIGNIQ